MSEFRRGWMIAGGLGLTAVAKVVVSLPALSLAFGLQATPAMAKSETSPTENPVMTSTPDAPPKALIDSATAANPQCETPEVALQSIRKERALVAEQQKKLAQRKAEIALVEEKLGIEKASLTELKSTIETLLKKVDAAQTSDVARLVAFYQNMKPADAARIMNNMDIEVTIMVLAAMKPRDAAPIVAKMDVVRAQAVSKIILERSKLPGDQRLNGIRLN